jgi:hypothetical protein
MQIHVYSTLKLRLLEEFHGIVARILGRRIHRITVISECQGLAHSVAKCTWFQQLSQSGLHVVPAAVPVSSARGPSSCPSLECTWFQQLSQSGVHVVPAAVPVWSTRDSSSCPSLEYTWFQQLSQSGVHVVQAAVPVWSTVPTRIHWSVTI